MTALPVGRGLRPLMFAVSGCLAVMLATIAGLAPSLAEPAGKLREAVTVHLDQAALLPVPSGTATLVIGNPLIADAAVQGGTMVVTAKSYGTTNLVALDRAGATVAEYPLQVVGPIGNLVVVYRGIERETYSCS